MAQSWLNRIFILVDFINLINSVIINTTQLPLNTLLLGLVRYYSDDLVDEGYFNDRNFPDNMYLLYEFDWSFIDDYIDKLKLFTRLHLNYDILQRYIIYSIFCHLIVLIINSLPYNMSYCSLWTIKEKFKKNFW